MAERKGEVHNVHDRRHGWIGPWDTEPLDITKLTPADIGRTVIYRDATGKAEAGTLSSWNVASNTVWARYSTGDTAAGADAGDLVFGISGFDPAERLREDLAASKSADIDLAMDQIENGWLEPDVEFRR